MNERAERVVTALIEDGDHSEHIKAHELVQKWDRAHASYLDLQQKREQADKLHKELGEAVGLRRALAHVGAKWEDVERFIQGAQVVATDNYKRQVPALVCQSSWCGKRGRPQPEGTANCPSCDEPLKVDMVPTPPQLLRTKLARYYVGVVLKGGRKVWFQDPVPPR